MTHPMVEFKNIKKSFGPQDVLTGVDLKIYQGETMAIIGKSGSGKSVLLKHIVGLMKPDSGLILLDGKNADEMSKDEIKAFQKNFSYMFQDNALFDFLNIYENIALPLKETTRMEKDEIKEKVTHKMAQLSLGDVWHKFPSQLSGGMRKRVALARALITEPDTVLFDEPTTGLDPVRKNNVYELIKECQQKFGFTSIIVSHDIPQVFYISQRIAMIEEGRIRFSEPAEDILDSHNKILSAFMVGQETS